MKFKDFKLEVKEVTESGQFSGHAAVFGNLDLGRDIIAPGAFTKTIAEKTDHPVLWSHRPGEPIGVNTLYREDGKGLYVEGQLVMKVQRAAEVHALMQAKAIKGLSIGYETIVDEYNKETDVRTLKEIKLWEYSLVTFPMNPEAQVEAVKAADLAAILEIFGAHDLAEVKKKLLALRAEQSLGAAKQDDIAPEILHAGLRGLESISQILL